MHDIGMITLERAMRIAGRAQGYGEQRRGKEYTYAPLSLEENTPTACRIIRARGVDPDRLTDEQYARAVDAYEAAYYDAHGIAYSYA